MNSLQFEILTGMKARIDEDGVWRPNVFYRSTKEDIYRNFGEAKRVYKAVFRMFISTWMIRYWRGEVDYVPSRELEDLVLEVNLPGYYFG